MYIENPSLEELLKKIDEKISKAEADGSDIEIRDCFVEKGDLYLQRGDHENFRLFYLKAVEKTAGGQKKLEFYLAVLNSYFLTNDLPRFVELLQTCKTLNDESGDWEKKNKLIVYEGILNIVKRDFQAAAGLLLSAVNTFNAPEVVSFETLVKYAAILAVISLPRRELKEKLISNSEIITVMAEDALLNSFVLTVYESKYESFFHVLLQLHDNFLSNDRFFKSHKNYVLKRARIVIYNQYLESYKTVRLDKMARDFGISVEFLDKELAELISTKHLNCHIDSVNGVVNSSRGDSRMAMYRDIVKHGDALIERMHKLSKFAQI